MVAQNREYFFAAINDEKKLNSINVMETELVKSISIR
jgi:hypothetical protein